MTDEFTHPYLLRPLRTQEQAARDIAEKVSAFLAGAGSSLGAMATHGLGRPPWLEETRGAAPASTKEADQ